MSIIISTIEIVLIIWLVLLYVVKYKPINTLNGRILYDKTYNRTFYFACSLIFFITASRYWWFGGPDTHNYVYYFQGIKDSYYFSDDSITNIGFILVADFVRLISTNKQVIIFFLSVFTLIPIMWGINKLSGDKFLSLIFFIVANNRMWIASMTAEKQFFSISLIVIGIVFLYKEKKKSKIIGIILIVSSFLFHYSTFVMVILMLLFSYKRYSNKFLYISIIVCWITLGFNGLYENILNIFMNLFSSMGSVTDRFSGYIDDDNYLDFNMINLLPYNLFAAALVYYSNLADVNRRLLQIFIFGVCIFDLLASNQIGIRMTYAFHIVGLMGFPNIINIKKRKVFYILTSIVMCYTCWRVILGFQTYRGVNLLNDPWFDYKFFWQ